ncbi:hypothetical protein [Rhodococcus sp. NPDC006774]|uniref:hypothetical protein n=1 Tax=Rhodococcus sp. NPDC006774 TaxID=3157186 RepID=UPI0033EF4B39
MRQIATQKNLHRLAEESAAQQRARQERLTVLTDAVSALNELGAASIKLLTIQHDPIDPATYKPAIERVQLAKLKMAETTAQLQLLGLASAVQATETARKSLLKCRTDKLSPVEELSATIRSSIAVALNTYVAELDTPIRFNR